MLGLLRTPAPLRLSDWADDHFYLSPESSGTEGPWRTLPYQRGIMDMIGSDEIPEVSFQKSARLGYTKMLVAASAYWITHKRRTGAIWQPVDSDAKEFKADEINPVLRDVKDMREAMVVDPEIAKSKHNTIDRVDFKGATLYVRGGKAGRSYRRLTLDFAIIDEFDGFPLDIEGEGSSRKLAGRRVMASPFGKLIAGSTPKTKNESQIEQALASADVVLHRYLPCPECGHMHVLKWANLRYDDDNPRETARFHCPACEHPYGYEHYSAMDAEGRWQAEDGRYLDEEHVSLHAPDGEPLAWPQHVGVFAWGAYSYIQTWGDLAGEWVESGEELERTGDYNLRKTFIQTQLAETWQEDRHALEPKALMARRETYAAQVPAGVLALSLGVDTQDDRLECEVVGHGLHGERWGIDFRVLDGDPADGACLKQLDALRRETFEGEGGNTYHIMATGIDTGGHRTTEMYRYCQSRYGEHVYALKGIGGEGHPKVSRARKVPIAATSRKVRLYSVGVDAIKNEWMSLLGRERDQRGYQHIPDHYSNEWCHQAVGEVYVRKLVRGRWTKFWKKLRARVEGLDCRTYAVAALEILNPPLQELAKAAESDAQAPGKANAQPTPAQPARRRPARVSGRSQYFKHRGG